MKKFFVCLFVALFSFAGLLPDAEARRMGGGGNLGMQRQAAPKAPPQQNLNRQATPNQPAAGAKNRSWLGPIAGLAAGLGLAALFSHLGLGEGLANFVMLALLVLGGVMLVRFLMRRASPARAGGDRMAYAGPAAADSSAPTAQPFQSSHSGSASTAAASAPSSAQAFGDFDVDAFVKQAKVQFIRLQAAHDEGNLDDIRDFTSPEIFAEIRLQLSDRGQAANRTDVVELNAEVIDVVEEDNRYIVSVRFTGLIREQQDAAPAPFDEIWHLTKPSQGDRGWVIAGIQQTA